MLIDIIIVKSAVNRTVVIAMATAAVMLRLPAALKDLTLSRLTAFLFFTFIVSRLLSASSDPAVLDPDDSISKLSDFLVMSDHHYRLSIQLTRYLKQPQHIL